MRVELCLFDCERTARDRARCRCRSAPATSGTASCPLSTRAPGPAVWLPRCTGRYAPRDGPAIQPGQAADRPVRARAAGRTPLAPRDQRRGRPGDDLQPDLNDSAPFVPKSRGRLDTASTGAACVSPQRAVARHDRCASCTSRATRSATRRAAGARAASTSVSCTAGRSPSPDAASASRPSELMPCQAFASEQFLPPSAGS